MIDIGPFCLKSIEDTRPFTIGRVGILLLPTTSVYFPVHRSSQISILSLAKHFRPGMTVLDIGTGTGILAVCAEKLGASRVVATENNLDALKYAKQMIATNGCTKVELIEGSFSDDEFDLCLCNIDQEFIRTNRSRIKANKIIGVDDKSTRAIVEHLAGRIEEQYGELMPETVQSETFLALLRG